MSLPFRNYWLKVYFIPLLPLFDLLYMLMLDHSRKNGACSSAYPSNPQNAKMQNIISSLVEAIPTLLTLPDLVFHEDQAYRGGLIFHSITFFFGHFTSPVKFLLLNNWLSSLKPWEKHVMISNWYMEQWFGGSLSLEEHIVICSSSIPLKLWDKLDYN